MRKATLAALPLALVMMSMACDQERPALPPAPYDVYSAFLNQRYVNHWGHQAVVLNTSTISFSEDFPTDMLRVSDEALREYTEGLSASRDLDVGRMSLPVPLASLTDDEFEELVYPEAGECDWNAFQDAFPGGVGRVSVTNIGFSADGWEAILCESFTTMCWHGHGGCARLLRDDDDPSRWILEYAGLFDG
jgi:hypothetical protein